jgi:hypothetical protein
MGMGGDTRVVVIATESGSNDHLIEKDEAPFPYQKGDIGVMYWRWEGFEYMPHVEVRWDRNRNSLHKVWFGHLKPVGLEKEGQRVMISFESK